MVISCICITNMIVRLYLSPKALTGAFLAPEVAPEPGTNGASTLTDASWRLPRRQLGTNQMPHALGSHRRLKRRQVATQIA